METSSLILVSIMTFFIFFFGAIAGGKGLVLRPLLIFLGIPIHTVIASAVIAGFIPRLVKIITMHTYNKVDWNLVKVYFFIALFGSGVGAIVTIQLSQHLLEIILGVAIVLVGFFMLYNKKFGLTENKRNPTTLGKIWLYLGMGVIQMIGILVGGIGSIKSFFLMRFHGKSFISSSGTLSAIDLGAGIAAIIFIFMGEVDWILVSILIVTGSLGTYAGVHYGVKKGEGWVRGIMLAVIFISGIKLIIF